MNKMLFNFYSGIDSDNRGRFITDMLAMSDLELERSHDVIQWLFPLKDISAHNPAAPLLDDETILAMKNSEVCRNNLMLSSKRIHDFLIQNYAKKPTWIKKRNHNYLRITRIIKCCKIFDVMLSEFFHSLAMFYYREFPKEIGEETLAFWNEALYGEV